MIWWIVLAGGIVSIVVGLLVGRTIAKADIQATRSQQAPLGEIVDDLVGIWHDATRNFDQDLYEFLGMQPHEAAAWARDGRRIPEHLTGRLRYMHADLTQPGRQIDHCASPVWSKTGGGYNGIDGQCYLDRWHEGDCAC